MLRVLTYTLNGRASITLAGCAASGVGPRGQDSFSPGSSVTTCSFRTSPPLKGPFTNVDSVARKPGEHNSIHGCFASSYPRAHPLSGRCSSWIPDSGTQNPSFVDAQTFFLFLSLGPPWSVFIYSPRATTTTTMTRSFSYTQAVRTARREKERQRRRGEILQVTVSGQYPLPPIY